MEIEAIMIEEGAYPYAILWIRLSHISAVISHEYFFATSTDEDHHFFGSLRISSAASASASLSPSLVRQTRYLNENSLAGTP